MFLQALDPDFVTDILFEESSGQYDNLQHPTEELFQVHSVPVEYQLHESSEHINVSIPLPSENCISIKESVDQSQGSEEVVFQDLNGFEDKEGLDLENELFQNIEIDDPDDPTYIPGDESKSE